MFIRVKTVRGRRYAYLVSGVRGDGVVRQKVVGYLGSVAKLSALGVPSRLASRFHLDPEWANSQIARLELTVEEGVEAARTRYAGMARAGRVGTHRRAGGRPRDSAELAALIRLSRKGFESLFRPVSDLEYEMR